MTNWIVMSAVDVGKNNGVSFETNATGLTEAEADKEAIRRNKVEKAAGHRGVRWFKAQDPIFLFKTMMT